MNLMNLRIVTPCLFRGGLIAAFLRGLLAALLPAALLAAEPVKKSYDIPAGVAEQTLKTFSAQSGLEVLFATKTAGKTGTNAVKGEFTAAEAIARLLEGTGLAATADARSGAFTVTSDPNGGRAAPSPASARPENEEVVQLEKFVVEGERAGQARALKQKRESDNIMDAVSADAVGKFPDGNAAEALRRVPGISLEIDQSEGRFVVIRGVDSQLNNVTLNGQILASPAEQGRRGLSMDSVPAELISRLEVAKAVTPDMDHNAIGGAVNIVTQSVFDRPEGYLFGSVSAGYGKFNEKWGWWGASANYGRLLGAEKKWGVTAGFSYSFRNYASQTSDALNWTLRNGNYVPGTQESFDYDIERTRLGLNVALEHRPREGHELFFRINYNEFTDDEGRQKTGYEFALGTLSNQTATSGNFSQGRATKEFRDYKQNHLIDAYTFGGKHQLGGDYKLEWQIGMSDAERETPRRVDWEFRSAASAFPNSYVLGSGPIPIITPNAAFYDPASYPFRRARFRTDDEREDIYSLQADLRREIELFGRPAYWKAGMKYFDSEKHQDRQNLNYNLASGAANLFTLAQTGLAGAEPAGFMEGRYRYGPTINLPALQQFFRDNPTRFVFDSNSSNSNSLDADFDAGEEVTSGYLMAGLQPTANSTLIAGLRVERTEAYYAALERRNGIYSRLSIPKSYTQAMPGLHFTWRPDDRWVVRAAWTNTYGRAAYTSLAPRNVLDDIDLGGGVFQGSLSSGNPALEPYESTNFDLSLEYYLKNNGLVSVGVFHKRIDNPVYQNAYTLNNTTYGGRNYSTLGISRPENANEGEITGVEFNWQQVFTFLPAPFDGLGLNVNYTIVDSSVTIFGRPDELPFFKQSDSLGNIALVYEKHGFEARLAYSFNGDYLEEVGTSAANDGYTDRRRVWDAKLSYRINSRFRIYGEFTNLGEEPLRTYSGVPGRSSGYEIYAWNANFGLNWSL